MYLYVPWLEVEFFIYAAKFRFEIVLEFLDGYLCIVFPVITWWKQQVIDVHGCHFNFNRCWCFVVHEMESWVDSAIF